MALLPPKRELVEGLDEVACAFLVGFVSLVRHRGGSEVSLLRDRKQQQKETKDDVNALMHTIASWEPHPTAIIVPKCIGMAKCHVQRCRKRRNSAVTTIGSLSFTIP